MKDKVFHVSVALLTAMVSVAMSFDALRLTGIVVDGAQDDWGDRGFRVERLALHDGAGGNVTPAPDGAGTLRFGWDDGGLLLLLALPTSRVENTTGTVCTVNLYPFYKDIIRARLVEDVDGGVSLRDIDPDVGWLGDAKSFAVEQAKRSKGDPKTASWLPSAYVANLWSSLNTRPAGRLGVAGILEATKPQ